MFGLAAGTSRGDRATLVAVGAFAVLALIETGNALWAPSRAPTDADWIGAARAIRSAHRAGDLIVAAPAWADPILRTHLGDLIGVDVAARMDDARFARVWEVSQRGARADETRGQREMVFERSFGRLRVRRYERPAATITFDFLEAWRQATVFRWDVARQVRTVCPWAGDKFVCPETGNEVRRQLVEIDTRVRRALLAPPAAGSVLAIEFAGVPLGRELAVAAGLHDVWARKYGTGTVGFKISIDGRVLSESTVHNRSGWHHQRIDTASLSGRAATVRFDIWSSAPYLRHFAFAAEARNPPEEARGAR